MENQIENAMGLSLVDEDSGIVGQLMQRKTAFCSLKAETEDEKIALFNATNAPKYRIGDCINQEINVKDVFVEAVEIANRETGELQTCPRVILIDENGETFQAVSTGIFNALKKMFVVFGTPSWDIPKRVKVRQITKGEKKILSLEAVIIQKKK